MSFYDSDNRYRFDLTAADDEARRREAAEQEARHQKEMRSLKRSMTKTIAIFCAVALVLGIGGGALAGTLISRNQASAESSRVIDTHTAPVSSSLPQTTAATEAAPETSMSSAASTSAAASAATPASKAPVSDVLAGNLYATSNGSAQAMSSADVYALVSSSVVSINTEIVVSTGYYRQSATGSGAGSGVVISQDGYIVTNNHVIEGASKISVALTNGEEYEATLIGTDDVTDVALLKIEASGLDYAVIGSSENLRIGDQVNVIGNALGRLSGTLTVGYISGLDRAITMSDGTTMNLLQMDAAVNPGNSGGGVFNASGELIGITVAKTSSTEVEGLGFSIPINDVLPILDELMTHGYVTGRPALGVSLVEISDVMTAMMYRVDYLGVYVNTVYAENGLQPGDCLISIDDEDITSKADVAAVLQGHTAGESVAVKVYRSGKEEIVNVTLLDEGELNSQQQQFAQNN